MKEKILESLKSLNPKTDAQWTQDGHVNLNAFKFVNGGESVTREQLEEAAPGFTRENAGTYFNTEGSQSTGSVADNAEGAGTNVGDANNEGLVDKAGKLVDTNPEDPLYEIGNLKASEAPGSERKTEEALTNPELHQDTLSESGNVVKGAGGDTSLDGKIKELLGAGKDLDLDNMSDEEVQKLREGIPERRNKLIEIRELFSKQIENEFYALARIEEAAQKAEPAEPLADLVKRVHQANVDGGANFDIDKGRQRVAQPVPPLNKK